MKYENDNVEITVLRKTRFLTFAKRFRFAGA